VTDSQHEASAGPIDASADTGADRRSHLWGIKLRALVAEHAGRAVSVDALPFPGGAALIDDGVAWVLAEGESPRSLGAALAWAIRRGATSLQLVAVGETGLIARRAQRMSLPISVWFPQDRALLPVSPEPLAPPPAPSPEHLALRPVIEASGAVVNVEHGVVFGEVRGLEVCRVVDQPTIGFFAELGDVPQPARSDGLRLEVGVGANDREAFQMLHGDLPTPEALARVVAAVESFRRSDAPQHPLNRLGQERYLRWRLEQEPALAGLRSLTPAEPPIPRPNLKDPVPCVGSGVDADGEPVTVVCSVGVDLELVPYVADVQARGADRVVVVTPQRDLVAVTRELAALLRSPVHLRTVG
jgi:hypothetical protein